LQQKSRHYGDFETFSEGFPFTYRGKSGTIVFKDSCASWTCSECLHSNPISGGVILMNNDFSEQEAQEELKKASRTAKKLLNNRDSTEIFLQHLEKKMKDIPLGGDKLANIPVMVSLIRSFVKKEYTDIPINSILAITGALIYFVSPVDLIPDWIPILGYSDDVLVINECLKWVESDVEKYVKWRNDNGKVLDFPHTTEIKHDTTAKMENSMMRKGEQAMEAMKSRIQSDRFRSESVAPRQRLVWGGCLFRANR
jgi:uncharacterized membrane protein YkvA (DUF1232 family)